jgi:hypothetical protein
MLASWSLSRWLRLPSRIALLLGLGALSASAAQANTAETNAAEANVGRPLQVPQQSAKSFGELRIWNDGGRIYVSEADKEARELRLGDTAEARHLNQLLEHDGATADSPRLLPHRLILVGSGGAGLHWNRPRQPDTSDKTGEPAATRGSDEVSGKTNPPASTGIPDTKNIAGAKNNQ